MCPYIHQCFLQDLEKSQQKEKQELLGQIKALEESLQAKDAERQAQVDVRIQVPFLSSEAS